jgi:hypothetical protein
MNEAASSLFRWLREPPRLAELTPTQWDEILRAAAQSGLSARLGETVEHHGLRDAAPPRALRQLDNARAAAEARRRARRYEAAEIDRALAGLGAPCLSLDRERDETMALCAPPEALAAVASRLAQIGWLPALNEADDDASGAPAAGGRFRHALRGHALSLRAHVLRAARHDDVASLFFEAAGPAGESNLLRLASTDRLLAAAFALFDPAAAAPPAARLFAIADMIEAVGDEPGFWEGLVPRAQRLRLTGPLHHALSFAAAFLRAPAPAHVMADSARVAELGPFDWVLPWAAPHLFLPTADAAPRFDSRLAQRLTAARAAWQRQRPLAFARAMLARRRTRSAAPAPGPGAAKV